MKKPKSRQKRSSARRKAAPTRAHDAPPATRRRRFAFAGAAVAAVLIGAGVWATEVWKDIQTSDPRHRDASRTLAFEVLNDDSLARRGTPAITAVGGSGQPIGHAKVQIPAESRDLGRMAVSEERSAEFSLRNVGSKPLEISQVRTSCMCTFAQVVIDDEESPAFNMEMHNAPPVQNWKGVVEPGLTATVRVIYRPSLMPVEGSVARNVKFNTNDPSRPVVELGIHATVQ